MTESVIFGSIYRDLISRGKEVSPRGQKVLEIENYSYTLPPYVRFVNFESRKLNLNYIKREFLWYLRGNPQDLSIQEHAKLWRGMENANGEIPSNYGQYIFGKLNQFDRVVDELRKDKDSRRASIVILTPFHILSNDKDRPCTYSLNFRIRDNKLNMSVHMRSQDAVYGMGNDAPAFSFIQEMLCATLKYAYPELELGEYHHSVDSFHVYQKHWDMIGQIASGLDHFYPITVPRISGPEEVDALRRFQTSLIPLNKFQSWLYES